MQSLKSLKYVEMEQYVLMVASELVNNTKEMVESTEKLEKLNSL